MIKIILCFYVLILSIGAMSAIFRFVLDVAKWHKQEHKTVVVPSADEVEQTETTTDSEVNESEVNISVDDAFTEFYTS